jgi:uncharacterized Zn finger protein
MGWYDYKPYVPVAQRRAQAAREVAKRLKSGQAILPVQIEGRKIATTFWGLAWCTNLEGYSDFANRLPRGRTYVRNGSVVHLKIDKGRIQAMVSGSELYDIEIEIAPVPKPHWEALKKRCAGRIGSLVELLQGKLSKDVMELVTAREGGLFPKPKEIKMRCSCPDYAGMCKHLAAVMYGVGNRLDASPELLFVLRAVDHAELIEQAIPAAPTKTKGGAPAIAAGDLGDIFGIEIDDAQQAEPTTPRKPAKNAAKATTTHAQPAAKTIVKQAAAIKTTAAPKKAAAATKTSTAPKKVDAKPATAPKKAAAITTAAPKKAAPKKAAAKTATAAKSTKTKTSNARKKG